MPDQHAQPDDSSDPVTGDPLSGRVELTNSPDDINATRDRLLKAIEAGGLPEAAGFAIRLAFDEAIANAFKHGHASLSPDTPIMVDMLVSATGVRISIEDQGPGFDPDDVPDPTLDENLARPSGRGIMLMRAYMTEVSFNAAGNVVTLVYERPAE